MNEQSSPTSSTRDLLSKVSRYEALFELAAAINTAKDIDSVGEVLARRLKFIVDVYAWRYVCLDGDPEASDDREPTVVLVDGFRGRAEVTHTSPSALSNLEMEFWRDRKTGILTGDSLVRALEQLPGHFRRDDLDQISVNTLVEDGVTRALYLFCRRRQPFTELDFKCLSMVASFFHRKIHTLWEQKKLRDLELAYLQREVMLRETEKLATLGRLSAGMAHELNNPAAIASQGAGHLGSLMDRLGHALYALGEADLTSSQRDRIEQLEREARERAKKPVVIDPVDRGDLEQEVEDWLDRAGVEDPWDHSSTLVTMGLCADELDTLAGGFDTSVTPVVIEYFSSKFMTLTVLEEIGHGARRISEIVKALKGYSYMDQAPVQPVDVREGLNDTLVMLSSRLRTGIKVRVDFADELPRVPGYGSELNQVWTNLIDNALSAMDGEGALALRAHQEEGEVVVEVEDTGPGIPVEVQKKVFDPFFTTKAPGEGTGLGLNISHGIVVEKHGGTISVDSKPGSTRFEVRLPIAGKSSPAVAENEPSS